MSKPIYLDHHATTPTDRRVLDDMLPFFCETFGNVGSRHCYGKAVRSACKLARQQVAALINADPEEIIFTSGATESDNMAIKGVAEALSQRGKHIITSSIEHKAVLDSCLYLESLGFEVTYLKPNEEGHHTVEQIEQAIRTGQQGSTDRTIMIAVMGANNEIGVINPTKEINTLAKKYKIIHFCDGAQTVGKVPFDVKELGVDMVALSGHKIYGPKGIGALYVSKGNPDLNLVPLFHGGGQEFGLRSGTLPVPLVVGLGSACELAKKVMPEENERVRNLRNDFLGMLREAIPSIRVNGDLKKRLPGNLNVCFQGIDSEFLTFAFKNIAVSQTSACSAGAAKPSFVLKALGLSDEDALRSVRFGLGRSTDKAQLKVVVEKIKDIYEKFGDRDHRSVTKVQEAGY